MADLNTLNDGDKSECCVAELELATDGDADWFICSKCGETCNGIFIKEKKLKKD